MHSQERLVSRKSDYFIYTPSPSAKNLFFFPTHLGYFNQQPDYYEKRSQLDSFLLMFIMNGACQITTDNHTEIAPKESIVLVDCTSYHKYDISDAEVAWLHFDGPMARSYCEYINKNYGPIISSNKFHEIYYSFDKIHSIFQSGETINEAIVSKYISNILHDIISADTSPAPHNPHKLIADSITYINENFKNAISLEDLAAQVSLSPFYFTRLFSKEMGMSPHQYIITTRISYAKHQLTSTSISVKEIAFNAGFTTESGFCSAFKKREGVTPSQYRTLNN